MRVSLSCPECQKDFQIEKWDHARRVRLGRAKLYCSKRCASVVSNRNRANHKLFRCQNCGKEQRVLASDRREKYCSRECYVEHDKERLQTLARKVGKENFKKISKTKKEMFASGKLIHPRIGKKHSQETLKKLLGRKASDLSKEKMSAAQVNRILSGIRPRYSSGVFYSVKNKKEFYYRSSWEKMYMQYLENKLNASYNYECLKIPYYYNNNKRWYVPDFFVDGAIIQEIKPQYLINKERNVAKFSAAREYCKQNNMVFEVLTEKELKQLGIL